MQVSPERSISRTKESTEIQWLARVFCLAYYAHAHSPFDLNLVFIITIIYYASAPHRAKAMLLSDAYVRRI